MLRACLVLQQDRIQFNPIPFLRVTALLVHTAKKSLAKLL